MRSFKCPEISWPDCHRVALDPYQERGSGAVTRNILVQKGAPGKPQGHQVSSYEGASLPTSYLFIQQVSASFVAGIPGRREIGRSS